MESIDDRVIKEAHYLLQYRATVRKVAKEFGISKSTAHFDLSKRLKKQNPALYKKISQILRQNFEEKHYRGGLSTKNKYLAKKRVV